VIAADAWAGPGWAPDEGSKIPARVQVAYPYRQTDLQSGGERPDPGEQHHRVVRPAQDQIDRNGSRYDVIGRGRPDRLPILVHRLGRVRQLRKSSLFSP